MTATRIVSFPSTTGELLHGILHEPPPSKARGVCVLLLSPGIKGRVGPHRLYLKIAAALVPLGFHVLRFDFHGLGDSEGELSESVLVDMYNSIQSGRYVGDTIAAMDWLGVTFGIRRFVGSGLCGGSITALATAQVDSRIECLLGISLPTLLEGGPENWARVLTQQQVRSLRGAYFRKLTDLKSWARLLSGKSSYRVIWRVLKSWMRGVKAPEPDAKPSPRARADSTNPLFASAFLSMLDSARPILLVFSGADRLHSQFAENFENHYDSRIRDLRCKYEVHVIPHANHVLSDPAWVRELLQVSTPWLEARFRHEPRH
jgi:pimeloyl-ACP methyl ester carboxylesterase